MKVLIIDDEAEVRDAIAAILGEQGTKCDAASDVTTARALLANAPRASYDLILLDLRLPPGASGFEFLEDLRASGDATPVIIVSGAQDVDDRVRGLRSGADDYIVKPFSPEEFLARIEAVDRRRHSLPIVQVGSLVVDLGRRHVERDGERIDISPREFDLLLELLEARGEACARADLLRSVWGIEEDTGTNVVEVQVARLRRKIDRGRTPLIHTVTGVGYRLVDLSEASGVRSA